jgi:hypothetical protein
VGDESPNGRFEWVEQAGYKSADVLDENGLGGCFGLFLLPSDFGCGWGGGRWRSRWDVAVLADEDEEGTVGEAVRGDGERRVFEDSALVDQLELRDGDSRVRGKCRQKL